jgi:hypothetical protein
LKARKSRGFTKIAKGEKKKKKSFVSRMSERGRQAKQLGMVLRDEPRSFPSAVMVIVRRSLRAVWRARGGGLYACGFVVTFVYLEIRMFFVDIFEAESISGYFSEAATEMLFKYLGESIQNTITAFMWPVWFVQYKQPWGIVMLVGMYLVFANLLKSPLENWLFHDEPPEEIAG